MCEARAALAAEGERWGGREGGGEGARGGPAVRGGAGGGGVSW